MMSNTIPERIYQLANENPEREMLRFRYPDQDDVVLTRGQLFQAARVTANQLAEAGAVPGDLVIIVQRDLLALLSTFFGATLLGAIPSILPFATEKLHPDRYQAAMTGLLHTSEPSILVTDSHVVDSVRALIPDDDTANLPTMLVIDPVVPAEMDKSTQLDGPFDPNNIALLQHSSGTTGLQKGVALSHRAIFDQLDAYGHALDFTPDDVVVSWLPLYHDMGLIAGFLMPILGGARLVLMSPFDWVRAPFLLLQAISELGGTLCWLPNFAYNFCAQKIRDRELEAVNLSSLRAVINCSEPIYDASHRLFAERFVPYELNRHALATCYAMAETVFAVSQSKPGQPVTVDEVERDMLRIDGVAQPSSSNAPATEHIVSSGYPIKNMEIKVLDAEMQQQPERRVGQIAVRSPYMLTEYYHRPDATEAAFHEGWYLTGDMGYMADGEVFVLGRKKDLIIVGGRNVYPRDLEALMHTVDGVHPGRVAAFGIPNPQMGTEEVAVVAELNPEFDNEDSKRAISVAIRRAVAGGSDVAVRYVWLVPRGWLIKTSSGKVARAANRDKFMQEYTGNLPGS